MTIETSADRDALISEFSETITGIAIPLSWSAAVMPGYSDSFSDDPDAHRVAQLIFPTADLPPGILEGSQIMIGSSTWHIRHHEKCDGMSIMDVEPDV